jgi:hypothetical protein
MIQTRGRTNVAVCPCRRNAASSASATESEKRLAGRALRRSQGAAGWALPSIGLVLVPKCPMCIAAWLALGGGLGISFTAASWLRTGFIWLCWGALALMTVLFIKQFKLRRRNISAAHPN